MSKSLNYAASEAAPVTDRAEARATWRDFVTLAKPGILRSNLFVTLAGFWLASQWKIDFWNLIATLAGTMLIVGSSGVFNNYLDREMDTKMERTRNRALPTGRIAPGIVLTYAIVLGVLGLAILFGFCGVLTGVCGAIGMFAYVVLYTMWLKRTSTWSTSLGGISGAMPPVSMVTLGSEISARRCSSSASSQMTLKKAMMRWRRNPVGRPRLPCSSAER